MSSMQPPTLDATASRQALHWIETLTCGARKHAASRALACHLQHRTATTPQLNRIRAGGYMAEKTTEIAPRERQRAIRREPLSAASPFGILERFADEIDSVFDDFGLGRSWIAPRWAGTPRRAGTELWAPVVEVNQQNNELVVRADLPGMKKDEDRKSTRLNSSHPSISYAVFCLKKKKKNQ